MSVLIIGGDKIAKVSETLKSVGVQKITHWDARKKASACRKVIPEDTQCVIMLTSFLNHNAMKHFKSETKKRNLPLICSKHSSSCVYQEYVKMMGIKDCSQCYAIDGCKNR